MTGIKKQIPNAKKNLDNTADQAGVHKGPRHSGKHKNNTTSASCLPGCSGVQWGVSRVIGKKEASK